MALGWVNNGRKGNLMIGVIRDENKTHKTFHFFLFFFLLFFSFFAHFFFFWISFFFVILQYNSKVNTRKRKKIKFQLKFFWFFLTFFLHYVIWPWSRMPLFLAWIQLLKLHLAWFSSPNFILVHMSLIQLVWAWFKLNLAHY